jgi:hypothetical protein
MATTNLPFETIYSILQYHFRPPPTAPSMNPVQVPERIIQRKAAEIVACIDSFAKADRHIEVMREEIVTLDIKREETTRRTEAMIEQHSESDAARDEIMGELMTRNEELGIEIAEHNERIRILTWELKTLDHATEAPMIQWPRTHGSKIYRETGKQSVDPIVDRQAQQVLHKFYNGSDLSGMCTITDFAPSEIFRLLQALMAPPSSRLPGNMEVPIEWHICVPKLCDAVRGAGFLCSASVFEGFRSDKTILEAVELFPRALHEFGQ